jgi:hypothetical protein
MNLTAFSLLASNNPGVDKNQEMELTFRSLSYYIGPSGSTRLLDPTKSGPSASKTERITESGSSVGSSSEANSPVSLTATKDMIEMFEEFNKTQGKLDKEAATKTRDSSMDFTIESSGIPKTVHQLCVIITEVAEEGNHEGSKEVDLQVEKSRSSSKKEKEKIHVSAGEWRIIMTAINHGTEVPADSRREVLMGYQYALHQRKKKLREEREMFMRSRGDDSMSSGEYWDEYNDALESNMERHRDPKHNRRTTAHIREESYTKSQSAQQSEEEEDFIQDTPEAALVAAQAYLLTMQPEPADPREHIHQAAIRSLGLVENWLMRNLPEGKATHRKERRKEESKCKPLQNNSSDSSEDERRQKRMEDARNIIAQTRVNNSRYAWKEENYEDDEKEIGALCFTRRVRKTWVPKGFKLPHHQEKYDGSQGPNLWLSDYLQAVQILGGTRATAMQSL